MSDASIVLAGEEVELLPERALHWPREETLFVSDLHVGKVATMRALGSPLPGGSTSNDMRRLTELIERKRARRLVLLGDLYHARIGRVAQLTAERFARWRDEHSEIDILLVPGNHDREAGLPEEDLGIEVVPQDHALGPFALRHEPDLGGVPPATGYVLAGHLHPGAAMRGVGRERIVLPCFWVKPEFTILPAFGSATGSHVVRPSRSDRVFAIADDEVISL